MSGFKQGWDSLMLVGSVFRPDCHPHPTRDPNKTLPDKGLQWRENGMDSASTQGI